MNAQQNAWNNPPPYNPPYNPPAADDEDEKPSVWTRLYNWTTIVFIVFVAAIAIAELVLALQDRGLSHQALETTQNANTIAQAANGTSERANEIAQRANETATHVSVSGTRWRWLT